MQDYVDTLPPLVCAFIYLTGAAGRETARSAYVTSCDRQTEPAEQSRAAAFLSRAPWRVRCVSLQDGLVQAAALREGLQRLLHSHRHQEGSQVSVAGDVDPAGSTCDTAAGMWLSRKVAGLIPSFSLCQKRGFLYKTAERENPRLLLGSEIHVEGQKWSTTSHLSSVYTQHTSLLL